MPFLFTTHRDAMKASAKKTIQQHFPHLLSDKEEAGFLDLDLNDKAKTWEYMIISALEEAGPMLDDMIPKEYTLGVSPKTVINVAVNLVAYCQDRMKTDEHLKSFPHKIKVYLHNNVMNMLQITIASSLGEYKRQEEKRLKHNPNSKPIYTREKEQILNFMHEIAMACKAFRESSLSEEPATFDLRIQILTFRKACLDATEKAQQSFPRQDRSWLNWFILQLHLLLNTVTGMMTQRVQSHHFFKHVEKGFNEVLEFSAGYPRPA